MYGYSVGLVCFNPFRFFRCELAQKSPRGYRVDRLPSECTLCFVENCEELWVMNCIQDTPDNAVSHLENLFFHDFRVQ